ncbi:MAG: hypothetical protein JRI79_08915 [Deltaproteobacteria bacterium]|nr:hypothetical protein [Deltaproteobacteria bacterium]MBW1919392.1 hypothetical protein [Deltaproteobacteria bacterium]MBW1934477.1 hypothetical protein [Deltaproteobacteria bacterium]MBW1978069.1 hypothetical protein [Deltaproteobacteria bacterium]MBW2044887.1 hypothetical protein [Deltaproteobacteria bacterium]
MASKTKKIRQIRKWKKSPNKRNLRADAKRFQRNREILEKLAAEDASK